MSVLKRFFCAFALSFLFVLQSCAFAKVQEGSLPQGFSFLSEVDSTIVESPRYVGHENFLGRPIPGYVSTRIVSTTKAAQALSSAQKDFVAMGYSLVVYDAYRPQRAVDAFMLWSKDVSDQAAKSKYYPTIDKKDVFKLGYVAEKSGHSRGSTFDVTLIKLGLGVKPVQMASKTLTDGSTIPFLDDNTIDMGASFDLFHPCSHHDTQLVNQSYAERRNLLRSVMKKHGFKEYAEEWWHYTLADEPFAQTYFDFVTGPATE